MPSITDGGMVISKLKLLEKIAAALGVRAGVRRLRTQRRARAATGRAATRLGDSLGVSSTTPPAKPLDEGSSKPENGSPETWDSSCSAGDGGAATAPARGLRRLPPVERAGVPLSGTAAARGDVRRNRLGTQRP